MSEKDIRDQLAKQLQLIEPGLMFVATNYPLPSDVGSRGLIDILARDATGCFVIIELKRSDSTAREALHELAKYVELFQRAKGLGLADVRTVIVSTTWRELLAPFSQAAREWSVSLRGYRLALDSDGVTPTAAQELRPLEEALLVAPTPVQVLIQTRSGDVDAAWRWAAGRLAAVGVEHLVGFDLRHRTYDPGVYLVLGRMNPESPQAAELSRLAKEHGYDLSDAREGYELEHAALYHLCQEYAGFMLEDVAPHSLATIRQNPAWHITAVRRTGAFTDELVFTDEDLVGDSSTTGGLSDAHFHGTARTGHHQRWDRLISRVQLALAGNESWSIIVTGWLEEIASDGHEVEVSIDIFNPCDLVAAFAFGWPDQLGAYLPGLQVVANAGGKRRTLEGCLVSARTFRSVFLAFEVVYGDPQTWWIERAYGKSWRSDLEFIGELGLRYAVFEGSEERASGDVLDYEDNQLLRRPAEKMIDGAPFWHDCEPAPELVTKNRHEFEEFALMLQQHIQRAG
ncbi:endonuclease NucS domain-containing protein [Micromonospora sp. NPDC003241]